MCHKACIQGPVPELAQCYASASLVLHSLVVVQTNGWEGGEWREVWESGKVMGWRQKKVGSVEPSSTGPWTLSQSSWCNKEALDSVASQRSQHTGYRSSHINAAGVLALKGTCDWAVKKVLLNTVRTLMRTLFSNTSNYCDLPYRVVKRIAPKLSFVDQGTVTTVV